MGNPSTLPRLNSERIDELVNWSPPAALLHLKERAFWQAVHDGIPHYRLNSRKILFRMSEVEAWLATRRVGGAA